jgi:hypothetical protein
MTASGQNPQHHAKIFKRSHSDFRYNPYPQCGPNEVGDIKQIESNEVIRTPDALE